MQFPARQESNVSTRLPVQIRLGTRFATRAVADLLKAQRGLCGRRAMEVKDAEVIPATADRDWGLVEALRQGEATAAERLVATFGDRAYRLAIGITGNQQDAEEAVQDAFWSVIQKIDSFRGDSSLGSWIYRIVANAAYQKLRRRAQRRDEISLGDVLP